MKTVWKVGDRVENRGESGIVTRVDTEFYENNPWCVIEFDDGCESCEASVMSVLIGEGWKLADGNTP